MSLEPTTQGKPTLEINASCQFASWLYEQNISLAFTTYQAGKLLFIGLQTDGKLSVSNVLSIGAWGYIFPAYALMKSGKW
ncbi:MULTISPECIES: hypothetical protein [unclassified Nostoc]|uniref:hypothetical protein n=1 Tax=unclassified Nostoc TaxID=2593658 RepID=UPI0025FF60DD|nr:MULTISPECIES: hypothetical protein [unclassified Nostoc]